MEAARCAPVAIIFDARARGKVQLWQIARDYERDEDSLTQEQAIIAGSNAQKR